MTFGNPLTGADGVLVRDRIRSANYAAGVAGWTLTRDGASQVGALQVLGMLGASSITTGALSLAGQDLGQLLADAPRGVIARGYAQENRDTAPTVGTTEQAMFRAQVGQITGGRAYRFAVDLVPWLVSGTPPVPVDVSLRFTTDGTTPDVTSSRLAVWRAFLPASGMGPALVFQTKYEPVADVDNLRICLTLRTMVSTAVTSIYGSRPTEYVLLDEGPNPFNGDLAQVSVASGTPDTDGTVRYVRDFGAVWSGSYGQDGAAATAEGDDVLQGWSTNYGQRVGLVGFDAAAIQAATAGASVVACSVSWQVKSTQVASGAAALVGTHTYGSEPASWSAAATTARRVTAPAAVAGETATVQLGAGVGADFASGAASGLALGPALTTDSAYMLRLYGSPQLAAPGAPAVPTLRLTYDK